VTEQPPPRNAGKAAIIVVAIVIAIVIAVFIGLNISRYKSVQQPGQPEPGSAKQGPQDLGTENQR
jgi:hypothetical protein